MNTYTYRITVDQPVEVVYSLLMDQSQYPTWSEAWGTVSQMIGTWAVGDYVSFIDSQERGTKVRVEEMIPHRLIKTRHVAMVDGMNQDIEVTDDTMKAWIGTEEIYQLESINHQTLLTVIMVMDETFAGMVEEGWPKALQRFKAVCESL